jgi:hypothetical protein
MIRDLTIMMMIRSLTCYYFTCSPDRI